MLSYVSTSKTCNVQCLSRSWKFKRALSLKLGLISQQKCLTTWLSYIMHWMNSAHYDDSLMRTGNSAQACEWTLPLTFGKPLTMNFWKFIFWKFSTSHDELLEICIECECCICILWHQVCNIFFFWQAGFDTVLILHWRSSLVWWQGFYLRQHPIPSAFVIL